MQKFKQIREATATNPYAIGMATAKKKYGYGTGQTEDLPKKVITKAHEIAKKIKANESFDDVLNAMDLDLAFAQLSEEDQAELLNSPEFEQLDEISKNTLASYITKAAKSSRLKGQIATDFENRSKAAKKAANKDSWKNLATNYKKKAWNREDNIAKAANKLAGAK